MRLSHSGKSCLWGILFAAFAALFIPANAASAEEGAKGEAAAPKAPSRMQATDHYVHTWVQLPSIEATPVAPAGSPPTLIPPSETAIEAKPGRLTVVLFLASWCEPCQRLMPAFQRLQKRYQRLDADFVYMFAFDTPGDARGFMQEYSMDRGFLANHDVLKAFHNPELPTVYVGDRHGWIATRFAKLGDGGLAKLDEYLKNQTAY